MLALAGVADDICFYRGCQVDSVNHPTALYQMNTGFVLQGHPSMGSWITYGLGSENQNLPGFIAMCPGGYPIQETQNWQSGFLPGVLAGTYINPNETDIDKIVSFGVVATPALVTDLHGQVKWRNRAS